MKKLIILLVICFTSCIEYKKLQPIEKYKNKEFVLIKKVNIGTGDTKLCTLKNKDTIIHVKLLAFDVENLQIGDTIK